MSRKVADIQHWIDKNVALSNHLTKTIEDLEFLSPEARAEFHRINSDVLTEIGRLSIEKSIAERRAARPWYRRIFK